MKKRTRQPAFTFTLLHEMCASPVLPLPEDWQRTQLTSMWDGLAQMTTGEAPGKDDWRVLSDAVNLMEMMVEIKEVEDNQGLLLDAITALAQAGERTYKGLPLRLSGPGLQAVRAVLEDYSAVMKVLPARTMIRCHRLTERRVHAIQQSRSKSHDVCVVAV